MAENQGVVLRDRESGTRLFQRILSEAAERWPSALGGVAGLESEKAFRSGYGEALVCFEAARQAAPERLAIGRFLVERAQEALALADVSGERPLAAALEEAAAPLPLTTVPLSGEGRLSPRVPYRGRTWAGAELRDLAALLASEERLSNAAVEAIDWVVGHALDAAGEVDLSGRRFALLGAGAEIAPTSLLLEAGADVLWVDAAPVPEGLAKDSSLSGRLFVPSEPADLLRRPGAVAATLRQFSEGGALDVGLYAYAPGRGREWRLTGAMNAIVDALPAGSLRSVAMLVSPTTPVALRPEMFEAAAGRLAGRAAWQRALEVAGVLRPGHVTAGDVCLLRNVVSAQGAGYQAAQYVGKTLAAERWATAGPTGQGAPVSLSATVAPITMTRSLRHPVFEAAFRGAPAFGVEACEPETTRALNGLLLVHDLLDPTAPGAVPGRAASPEARARDLLSEQIHGGFFSVPWALDRAIQAAAVIGLAGSPGLLPGFVRAALGLR